MPDSFFWRLAVKGRDSEIPPTDSKQLAVKGRDSEIPPTDSQRLAVRGRDSEIPPTEVISYKLRVGIGKSLLQGKIGEVFLLGRFPRKPRQQRRSGGYAQRSTTTFFWVKKSTASQL